MPDLDAVIAACRAGHRRLFETLDRLDDDVVRAPSVLPDWTRGHVLTHLARNADSHVRILDGALGGESLEQYAGGVEERAEAIEAGSGRSAAKLADDVRHAALRLEDVWARMTPDAWDGHGFAGGAIWPCRGIPFLRWREVEVHHADLGLGYAWPDDYLAAELPLALAAVPRRLPAPDDRRRLLAWLLGRAPQPGDLALGPWQS
ncbi:MAG: maleylpyruvate isomerase N-terminal domain-containing protein [Acidimicrobiales bacterium]